VGARERFAGLIEQPLEDRCQVSQIARQVVVGFIQGEPCHGKVDLEKAL
jgi:hypothetical protein